MRNGFLFSTARVGALASIVGAPLVVIADAVRFGAGMGSIARQGGTSGAPRWMECARYHAEFSGAPPSVGNLTGIDRTDDVACRGRYADWMEDAWGGRGGAVYFSLHTNAASAPNTGSGTDTFIHDSAPSPGSVDSTTSCRWR